MLEREDQPLICACCGAEMRRDEAMPAPEGIKPTLYYHADFQACVRIAMQHLAEARPVMRAYLGATQ